MKSSDDQKALAAQPARAPHRWKPGQSGNPKGRPPKGSALAEAIRRRVDPDELAQIALGLARSGESESTRIAALNWLATAGYVKPAERHEIAVARAGDDDDFERSLDGLSLEQLEQLEQLERHLEERRAEIIAGRAVLALGDGRPTAR
ncbi:MAG: hypothetical protein KIT31_13840 [Deltaproteobacteria bacterium]|nr:hypothetical protein [Deltaproteobacteria bacterium]